MSNRQDAHDWFTGPVSRASHSTTDGDLVGGAQEPVVTDALDATTCANASGSRAEAGASTKMGNGYMGGLSDGSPAATAKAVQPESLKAQSVQFRETTKAAVGMSKPFIHNHRTSGMVNDRH